jgi:hypothetical protein
MYGCSLAAGPGTAAGASITAVRPGLQMPDAMHDRSMLAVSNLIEEDSCLQ